MSKRGNSKNRIKITIKKSNLKFHKIRPGDLLVFTKNGPLNSRTSPGNAKVSIVLTQQSQLAARQFLRRPTSLRRSAAAGLSQPGPLRHSTCPGLPLNTGSLQCPLLYTTCPAGSSSWVATQHRQFGNLSLGRSAAAGVSTRHSTTQFWQSDSESPPRGCRAAAGCSGCYRRASAEAAKQVTVNLNSGLLQKFRFEFTQACKLIPINSSFNVTFQSWSLKKAEVLNLKLKPCRCICALEVALTCQSYDLGLAASLTWSCRPGVTVFLSEVIN